MKKLLAALVLSLGTAAVAQQDNPQNTQAQQEQKRNEKSRVQTGIDASEVKPGATTGVDATEVGPGVRDVAGIDTAKEGTFKREHAFDVRGTMKGAALDGITLARQGLPDADLDVRKQTKVTLDGKPVEVGAIPEGAPVRAKFQLEGQEPVAVEISATSPKAGTQKKSKKDMPQTQPGTQDTQPMNQQ